MRFARWLACKLWGHEFGYWWGVGATYYRKCSICHRSWVSTDTGWEECR